MKRNNLIAVLFSSLLSISLFSCTSEVPEPINDKTFISELKDEHLVANYSWEKADIEIDNACSLIPQNGLIYVMNSTCSRCIGEFITFAERYKEANCTDPLSIVIDKEDSTTIEYYMEQAKLDGVISNVIKNNNGISVKDLLKENGVVLLAKNKEIIDSYKYSYE